MVVKSNLTWAAKVTQKARMLNSLDAWELTEGGGKLYAAGLTDHARRVCLNGDVTDLCSSTLEN